MLGYLPQVVDPVTMVGMVMGDDDPANVDDVGGKQLLAKVGPAVDEKPLARAFEQDR